MGVRTTSQRVALAAVTLGMLVCMGAGPLERAKQEGEAKKVEPVVIRMYNVQDLMLGRDHPYDAGLLPATYLSDVSIQAAAQAAGGGFGDLFGGEALGKKAALTSALSPDVLEEIIKRTVGVGTWAEEGGPGIIDRVGALLVITQTEANHEQIKGLIDQFRRARKMVSIRARWLLARPHELKPLLLNAARSVPQVLDLAAAARPDLAFSFIYNAHITCFDRQTVYLASGPAQVYVIDAEPVVAERAVGWDPTVTAVLFGAFLQVTPSVSAEGKEATLDIRSAITEKENAPSTATFEATSGEGTAKAEIDKPRFLAHTFRTTLRVPLDKPVLVGGMTSPDALEGKVIYLILEVSASQEQAAAKAPAKAGK